MNASLTTHCGLHRFSQVLLPHRPGQSFLSCQSRSSSHRAPPRPLHSPDHRRPQLVPLRRERTPAGMLLTTQGVNPFRSWCLVRVPCLDLVPPSLPWDISLTNSVSDHVHSHYRLSVLQWNPGPARRRPTRILTCNPRQLPRGHSPRSPRPRSACLWPVCQVAQHGHV